MASFPLSHSDAASLGLAARPLFELERLILQHIAEDRYAGAQIALARHGKLALFTSHGLARRAPDKMPVGPDTLFRLFSQTKMLTSAAIWALIEDGQLSPMDRIADHLPAFAVHGKAEITLHQVMTHQGGFPSADVSRASWADHAKMRAEVCAFTLDWTPGTRLHYHGRGAHLVQAMLIEAVTGMDYRKIITDRILAPLGLTNDIFIGVPTEQQHRCVDVEGQDPPDNSTEMRAAGLPHSGGYATARGLTAFCQMLLGQGRLGGARVLSPRMIAYGTRNHTGERPDAAMSDIPMHRGLGPHVRGVSARIRGLGTIGAMETFGHGGVGSSYSWADPTSGVSFTYLTNTVSPEPWHTLRMDRLSNMVHAAID